MKEVFIIILLFFMAERSFAEEETLLNGDTKISFFGGPVWKLTNLNGDTRVLTGVRGGWIINRSFVIGLGGYGMMSGFNMHGHRTFNNHDHGHKLGYGGLEIEYINNSDKLIHYSLYALIGSGGARFDDMHVDEDLDHAHNTDTIFVFEPALNGIVNINKWFRLGAGVSYRMISGVDTYNKDSSDIGGFYGIVTFKFGKF